MSPFAPNPRPIALGLLAAALLLGRLALDLHPYEHPLDAGDEIEFCQACAAGGSPALQAGAYALSAASPVATPEDAGQPVSAVPPRPWARPPYRGPPPLV